MTMETKDDEKEGTLQAAAMEDDCTTQRGGMGLTDGRSTRVV